MKNGVTKVLAHPERLTCAIQAKGRLFCPKIKLNVSLLRGKNSAGGDGKWFRAKIEWFGDWAEDRTRVRDRRTAEVEWLYMREGEGGDSLEALWLPGQSPVPLSQTGGGFTAGSALELAEAAPSTAWEALDSCCHKHQRDLKTLFQTLCFSQ